MHTFITTHVDRVAHRRRLRAVFFTTGDDHREGHGFTAMSDLVSGDMFGPQELDARHAADPLAAALELAKSDPNVLAVPVITERQYTEVECFESHSATGLRSDIHGVVLPFLYAPAGEDLDDVDARENLLRAGGFSAYTVDVDFTRDDTAQIHRNVALLLEDVLDDIAHLKADAHARVMLGNPQWPLVTVRSDSSWDPDRCRSHENAEQTQQGAR